MTERYWLVKNNPIDYSIADLEADGTTPWEGVRNYEARNNLQEMAEGDLVLYHHSSADPSGVAGVGRVAREAYPDPTQFEEGHPYHDADSDPEDPTWYRIDVEYVETFDRLVPLSEIKEQPALSDMVLVRRSRLSVQPVQKEEFERVVKMGSS